MNYIILHCLITFLFNYIFQPSIRFKINGMTRCDSHHHGIDDYERLLRLDLNKCLIPCIVHVYESYFTTRDGIYDPQTDVEMLHNFSHAMLLVAYGYNRSSRFFKFQDSNGRNIGHRGFLKVAPGRGLIDDYFVFDVPHV